MEKELINIIKTTLKSKYIGDDCAHLDDLGIVITQDSLVENVHFIRTKITPWQLGWKTAMVNISDVCASGAKPKYMTISISLPKDIDKTFIKDFYEGLKAACEDVIIVGGDITSSEKIFISATAIGTTANRNISSRANAQIGQKIIVSGYHGSSAAGLYQLLKEQKNNTSFIKAHLEPVAQRHFSEVIATAQKPPYAMMDSSDGLMDALSQIAKASNVLLEVDFNKIPFAPELKNFNNWKELILFGGEDYQLIATVDEPITGTIIGEVKKGSGVKINNENYTETLIDSKTFKHF